MAEFTRSMTAQAAALAVVNAARRTGVLAGPLATAPALADSEKDLFLKMFRALADRRAKGTDRLDSDEISSLFTFVFARAAEAVTNMVNGRPDDFSMLGMFDGKVPIYADDRITGSFKMSQWPTDAARAYWQWYEAEGGAVARSGVDPALPLFEALKWMFRVSCHLAIEKLETDGRI